MSGLTYYTPGTTSSAYPGCRDAWGWLCACCKNTDGVLNPTGPWELVVQDTFDTLNRSFWEPEVDCWGGGNMEKQCYIDDPSALRVEQGRLVLEARRVARVQWADWLGYAGTFGDCTLDNPVGIQQFGCVWTQPFTSARIRSKFAHNGSFKYARVEVRAQLPRGDFLWPAIWMLPTDQVYGTWAASGEIDIMEARGQATQASVVEGTLHYGGMWPANVFNGSGPTTPFPGVDLSKDMHNYVLEWTPGPNGRPKLARWLLDGKEFYRRNLTESFGSIYSQTGNPFDQRFHLIMNLAVGGNGFFDRFGSFTSPDKWDAVLVNWTRPRMEVDHVKVWKLRGTPFPPEPICGPGWGVSERGVCVPCIGNTASAGGVRALCAECPQHQFPDINHASCLAWPLVLDETFDGPLDRSLFTVEQDCWGGGNLEKQCYIDDSSAVHVQGGRLVIEARRVEKDEWTYLEMEGVEEDDEGYPDRINFKGVTPKPKIRIPRARVRLSGSLGLVVGIIQFVIDLLGDTYEGIKWWGYRGSEDGCTLRNPVGQLQYGCVWTQPFTSGRLNTRESDRGSWRYARVEVRAQLPRGDWLWPAIWMLPTDETYGGWAASGEIDIMEARGTARLGHVIEGTLHFGYPWPNNVLSGSGRIPFLGTDFSAGFHDFVIEWTADPSTGRPALMRWLLDGNEWHRIDLNANFGAEYTAKGQPFDQRFHLVVNVAVGGGFFNESEFGPFKTPDQWNSVKNKWPKPTMEIEHIRVWKQPGV